MKAAIQKAITTAKDAGFGYIKVELEGQIYRSGNWHCNSCTGRARISCNPCNGRGVVEIEHRNRAPQYKDCASCRGVGASKCNDCSGRGALGTFTDVNDCGKFMKAFVPKEVAERQIYGRFYRDGSVDSEYTMTIKIEDIEDMIHWIEAFKALARQGSSSKTIDVRGAGMHISLIPTATNGAYPSRHRLNSAGMENFTSEMSKLLPALYFVATPNNRSRSMQYRNPRISSDNKYSAIYTHNNTCIEFRVFETCYEKPEVIFDYFQVCVNSLKFYTNPNLKVKSLGKSFGFNDTRQVAEYFETPEQLKILNATVKHLKPVDKTYKKLKSDRGVYVTIKSLQDQQKIKMSSLRNEYNIYKNHYDEVDKRPLSDIEKASIDSLMAYDGYPHDEAVNYVKSRRQSALVPFEDFIQKNTKKYRTVATVTV